MSLKTMIAPEPSVSPAARSPWKVMGVSNSAGVAKAPAAPPTSIACNAPPTTPPARFSTRWRSVTPKPISYSPGRTTSPDTQSSFGPVDSAVPSR